MPGPLSLAAKAALQADDVFALYGSPTGTTGVRTSPAAGSPTPRKCAVDGYDEARERYDRHDAALHPLAALADPATTIPSYIVDVLLENFVNAPILH
jgi:hypothetical protein